MNNEVTVSPQVCDVVVVGGGPAGLMAAEVLSAAGVTVHLFDAMPTVGRKFLLAGIGGLNLTHAEALPAFVGRYAERAPECARWLAALGPQAVRDWAQGLGIDTFVGSSQRVFPTDMKAAPLLRAWLHRLRHPASGVPVHFHMRHRWDARLDRADGLWQLAFTHPGGSASVRSRAVLLALGGGSWARLGSDGRWAEPLRQQGVDVAPLLPANCGFDVAGAGGRGWSAHLAERFAGQPLKSVALTVDGGAGRVFSRKGEFVLTATGIEGSLVYAASALMRDAIARDGQVTAYLNLRPELDAGRVLREVSHPRGSRSLSSHLKSRLHLSPVHTALLHELLTPAQLHQPQQLAQAIQHLPMRLVASRPIDEAISTAGGVRLETLDEGLMLKTHPGVFCAGEMLDWEAPTGGYLLTACLASGYVAGRAMLQRRAERA